MTLQREPYHQAAYHLAAIIASTDDAIIGTDLDGTITSWSPGAERLFGYAEAEIVGQLIESIIPADRLGEEVEVLDRIRRGETVQHFETVRRRKDGALLNVSITFSPIRTSDGTVVGFSKIARDVAFRYTSAP